MLAVCAHPDDESFGLGAVISTLVDQGARVDLVCLTQGEASTLGSPIVDLTQARRCELAAAATELGITTVHQFDRPDGHLSSVDLPVLAWTLDRHVADTLNTEFDARFVGRAEGEIHVRLPVEHGRRPCRRSSTCSARNEPPDVILLDAHRLVDDPVGVAGDPLGEEALPLGVGERDAVQRLELKDRTSDATIVAKWTDGDHVPMLTRDLGDSVPGWTRRLTALEWVFIRTTCAVVSRVLR